MGTDSFPSGIYENSSCNEYLYNTIMHTPCNPSKSIRGKTNSIVGPVKAIFPGNGGFAKKKFISPEKSPVSVWPTIFGSACTPFSLPFHPPRPTIHRFFSSLSFFCSFCQRICPASLLHGILVKNGPRVDPTGQKVEETWKRCAKKTVELRGGDRARKLLGHLINIAKKKKIVMNRFLPWSHFAWTNALLEKWVEQRWRRIV